MIASDQLLADVVITSDQLLADLAPFGAGIEGGAHGLMMSRGTVHAINPGNPPSHRAP